MVSDKRAQKQAEELKENPHLKHLFRTHNILPVASYILPKILWLKQNDQELFNRTDCFLSSDSYLLLQLTGKRVSDPLNAEKAYYDVENREYPPEILNILGIDESKFPKVENIGYELGSLKKELISEFGISTDPKVILTTYDALAAFWGAGVAEEGDTCMVCGTCCSLRVFSSSPPEEKRKGILAQNFSEQQMYVVGGSNNLEGGLLEWAKNAFYYDTYSHEDEYIFQLMEQEAQESPLGAQGLIFLPYLIGERTPIFDPDVRGMFFGLERGHTRKDVVRAIFEAIGFLSLDMIFSLEKSGIQINEIRLSGGLAKNELISQIKADITGKEILLLEETETTALGCFILVAMSVYKNFDRQKIKGIQVKKRFQPEKDNHQKYLRIYSLFKRIYETNKENFKYRNILVKDIYTNRVQEISNL